MKFVATIMVFIGYVLVYAGVANGGKFATQPWMGILDDAYSQGSSAGASSGSSGGASTGTPATPTRKKTSVTGGKGTSSGSTPGAADTVPGAAQSTLQQVLNTVFGGL